MKIAMIAPAYGGINVYVEALSEQLRGRGHSVVIIGSLSDDNPYNSATHSWRGATWVARRTELIADRISVNDYDIVCFHYGKNDLEQLLPVVLAARLGVKRPPMIHFVHYLSRNLFTEFVPSPQLQRQVDVAFYTFFDGYVYFGSFAQSFVEAKQANHQLSTVAFLPETHSSWQPGTEMVRKLQTELHFSPNMPTVYWPGYAAHYKDHDTFLRALLWVERPLQLVIVGRGWRKKVGFSTRRIGQVIVWVLERELNEQEMCFVTQASAFGIFPYRQPKHLNEVFQGSGVLPNFLYNGKACVVNNEGCLAEYVANAGIVVRSGEPRQLAQAINTLMLPAKRAMFEKRAACRSSFFSLDTHATTCQRYFEEIING